MDGTGWDLIASYHWRKHNLNRCDTVLEELNSYRKRYMFDEECCQFLAQVGLELIEIYRKIDTALGDIARDVARPPPVTKSVVPYLKELKSWYVKGVTIRAT